MRLLVYYEMFVHFTQSRSVILVLAISLKCFSLNDFVGVPPIQYILHMDWGHWVQVKDRSILGVSNAFICSLL